MTRKELDFANMENAEGETVIDTPHTKAKVNKRIISNTSNPEAPLDEKYLVNKEQEEIKGEVESDSGL